MNADFVKHIDNTKKPCGKNSSVHYERDLRYKKALEQQALQTVDVHTIIGYINEFLVGIGMNPSNNPIQNPTNINYRSMKKEHNLADKRDIIWMKWTTDGFLGVVACSSDVNFDIPSDTSYYHIKAKGKWLHKTSGILVHMLKKTWDESFVLIFPLCHMPSNYKRGDIERGVGNYLIDKKVPIIDYYSHMI